MMMTKMTQYAEGLTVFRSDQCPYIEDAVRMVFEVERWPYT